MFSVSLYDNQIVVDQLHLSFLLIILCFQTAKGYILLFDVLGGGDDKSLYEPVYPK